MQQSCEHIKMEIAVMCVAFCLARHACVNGPRTVREQSANKRRVITRVQD